MGGGQEQIFGLNFEIDIYPIAKTTYQVDVYPVAKTTYQVDTCTRHNVFQSPERGLGWKHPYERPLHINL